MSTGVWMTEEDAMEHLSWPWHQDQGKSKKDESLQNPT